MKYKYTALFLLFVASLQAQTMPFAVSTDWQKKTDSISVLSKQSIVLSSDFINLYSVSVVQDLQGSEIKPVGAIDPTNISTGEANLIDNNYTNLCYNNSSTGTVNKELPAIDLGSSVPLGSVKVTWWTNEAYTASDYSIQGSNDGTNFTDLLTGLNSTGQAGQGLIYALTGNWQYLRVFCVQGNNTSWCVISELEAFELASGATEYLLLDNENFEVTKDVNGKIEIKNNSEFDADVVVKSIE